MNFDFDDDQSSFRDMLQEFFEKSSPPTVVRDAEPAGFDRELWERTAELGITSVAVPEDRGGSGFGAVELAIAAEHAGRWLAPVPVIESTTATSLLAALPASPDVDALLERAISTPTIVTVALHPVVDGIARIVPAGSIADVVLALRGDDLVAFDVGGALPQLPNLGSMPIADCPADGGTILVSGPEAVAAHGRAVDQWKALTAVALMGLAERALEIGVEYVLERHAFGVLIGKFQSIQHHLADDAATVLGGRLLAYESAWALANGEENASELAAMAFLFASKTAQKTAGDSLHFHGGYGFTMEYDIQLYLRRAKAWALLAGDPDAQYAALARARVAASEA
ncbi:MAG TPA: acyl-CoA dehydrogenase family protein [Acidimicrobiales bacterium]